MITSEKNLKRIKRILWFFIGIGVIEMVGLVYLTGSMFALIPGLITMIPAYIALKENRPQWNYFVAIWALIKYNPLVAGMMAFMIQDLLSPNGIANQGSTSRYQEAKIYMMIAAICFALIVISSLINGIMLIVRTAKQRKLTNSEVS